VIEVPIPHPRDPDERPFRELRNHVLGMLGVERRV
jgi:hypothetical protein